MKPRIGIACSNILKPQSELFKCSVKIELVFGCAVISLPESIRRADNDSCDEIAKTMRRADVAHHGTGQSSTVQLPPNELGRTTVVGVPPEYLAFLLICGVPGGFFPTVASMINPGS